MSLITIVQDVSCRLQFSIVINRFLWEQKGFSPFRSVWKTLGWCFFHTRLSWAFKVLLHNENLLEGIFFCSIFPSFVCLFGSHSFAAHLAGQVFHQAPLGKRWRELARTGQRPKFSAKQFGDQVRARPRCPIFHGTAVRQSRGALAWKSGTSGQPNHFLVGWLGQVI